MSAMSRRGPNGEMLACVYAAPAKENAPRSVRAREERPASARAGGDLMWRGFSGRFPSDGAGVCFRV